MRAQHQLAPNPPPEAIPAFCEGIQYLADTWPEIEHLGATPLLGPSASCKPLAAAGPRGYTGGLMQTPSVLDA